jgi:hypothetical protein
MLTTLCVELQDAIAFCIDVALAVAAPDPAVNDGCVAQGTVYEGTENPALGHDVV